MRCALRVLCHNRWPDACCANSGRKKIATDYITDPREFLDRQGTIKNERYNQLLDFDECPTWLVVDLFIKPLTNKRRVPFVDLLAQLFPHLGGCKRATHFVSQ